MTKSSDLCSCKSGYLKPTGEVLAQGESVGEFSDIGGRRIFVCDKCKQRQIRIGVHVYMPVGEEVETEQQEKMKDYNFSCQNCDEPFTILLPEQTTKHLIQKSARMTILNIIIFSVFHNVRIANRIILSITV
jgi:hypothetical protein